MTPTNFNYVGTELPQLEQLINYRKWILSTFAEFIHGTTVEIGAGIGGFSQLLAPMSSVEALYLIEPAANLYQTLVERFRHHKHVRCVNGFLADVIHNEFRNVRADTAIMINVLEHIDDDASILATLNSLLKPRGKLIIFVPALHFLYSQFDQRIGHYRRYTKNQLSNRIAKAKFHIITIRYFDIIGIFTWSLYFKLLRKKAPPESLRAYDRLLVPIQSTIENRWAPPIGKNLICVAQKT